MKRPMLISGITIAIVSAFLILFSKIASIIVIALAALVFILYFIKPLKLKKHVILPFVCVSALVFTVVFSLYNNLFINPVLKYDNSTHNITGKIITTPTENSGYVTFDIKCLSISEKPESIKITITMSEENAENLKLYDVISVADTRLYVPENNSGNYDITSFADGVILHGSGGNASFLWNAERTPYYYCLSLKEAVLNKIDSFAADNTAGVLKGMIFGDSSTADLDTIKAFRNSGIAHLLAVSGLHTSLWCSLIILIFKLLNIPEKVRNGICIVFLIAFCVISSFTPSVIRASFMMLILLVAPFFKRRPDSLNSLGFAVVILLLLNPYIITSASFQLSVTATLGVLFASSCESKIHNTTNKIKHTIPKKLIDYLSTSLIVSICAGIFTLPVSAYYFNVFSILSPIANLLCVKLSFYGMLSGIAGVALTFFENNTVTNIAIWVFDASDSILSAVISIAKRISAVKFCTIPVHKEALLSAIIFAGVIILAGLIFTKITDKRKIITITSVIAVICVFINIFIPIIPTKYENTLTVVSSGNNTNVILRSGTHYMYIANNTKDIPSHTFSYMPKATCETLDYYIVTYTSFNNLYDIESVCIKTKPQETHIAPSLRYLCESGGVSLPTNTIIGYTGNYTLNNKINIEIVDTYRMKYVIIKGNENTVYIHLHGKTDFSDVVDTSAGNVFIYSGNAPEKIPQSADMIIINSTSDVITTENYKKLKESGVNFKSTATHGNIKILL